MVNGTWVVRFYMLVLHNVYFYANMVDWNSITGCRNDCGNVSHCRRDIRFYYSEGTKC